MWSKRCVLCLSSCSQEKIRFTKSNISEDLGDSVASPNDVDPLHSEFPIFLLRKILQIPDKIFQSFVEGFGDPGSWTLCCNYCFNLVEDAKNVLQHMILLLSRYKKLQKEMKNKMLLSLKNEKNNDDDSKGVQNAVRSYFKSSLDTPLVEKEADSCFELQSDMEEIVSESISDHIEDSLENTQDKSIQMNDAEVINDTVTVGRQTANTQLTTTHEKDEDGKEKIQRKSGFEISDNQEMPLETEQNELAAVSDLKAQLLKNTAKEVSAKGNKNLNRKILPDPNVLPLLIKKDVESPQKCTICGGSYAAKYLLANHMKNVHGVEKPYKCKDCGECFENVAGIKRHKSLMHKNEEKDKNAKPFQDLDSDGVDGPPPPKEMNDNTDFDSGIPDNQEMLIETEHKESTSISDLNEQVSNTTKEISKKCDKTDENKKRLTDRNELPSQTAEDIETPQKCPACVEICPTKFLLGEHMKNVHRIVKPYKCKDCGECFENIVTIKIHKFLCNGVLPKEKHIPPPELILQLKPLAIIQLRNHLEKHIAEKGRRTEGSVTSEVEENNDNEREFSGAECQDAVVIIRAETSSTNKIGNVKEKLKCYECGKVFLSQHALEIHKKEEKRNHQCKICNKFFCSYFNLKMHVDSCHGTKKVPTSNMSVQITVQNKNKNSGRKSTVKAKSEVHEVSESEEIAENHVMDVRANFSCDMCGLLFDTETKLSFHKRLHDLHKTTWDCKICGGEGFPSPASLEFHVEVQHIEEDIKKYYVGNNEDQHKCDVCGKYFALNTSLFGHHRACHQTEKQGIVAIKCDVCGKEFRHANNLRKHKRIHRLRPHKCEICGKCFVELKDFELHSKFHSMEKPYKCQQCEKTYASMSTLNGHILSHTGEKRHKCHLCDKGYNMLRRLKIHVQSHFVSKPKRSYKCEKCGENCTNLRTYNKHRRQNHPEIFPFVCEVCGKRYPFIHILQKHMKFHENGVLSLSEKCKICDKVFRRKDCFQKHMESHSKEYDCKICKKSFVQVASWRNHMRVTHKEKPFECEICSEKFSTFLDLKTHKITHGGVRPFQCDICGLSFSAIHNLTYHQGVHDRERNVEKPKFAHTCETCGSSFKFRKYLKSHMRTHHVKVHPEKKPFQCSTCGKAFKRKSRLTEHSTRVHDKAKPFKCEFCGKSFSWLCSFNAHRRRHIDGNVKNFQCQECGKYFNKKNLKVHVKTHAGEKPFSCNYCDKSFSTRSGLRVHERTHTGEKPYKCKICDKSFTQSYTLILHARKHK